MPRCGRSPWASLNRNLASKAPSSACARCAVRHVGDPAQRAHVGGRQAGRGADLVGGAGAGGRDAGVRHCGLRTSPHGGRCRGSVGASGRPRGRVRQSSGRPGSPAGLPAGRPDARSRTSLPHRLEPSANSSTSISPRASLRSRTCRGSGSSSPDPRPARPTARTSSARSTQKTAIPMLIASQPARFQSWPYHMAPSYCRRGFLLPSSPPVTRDRRGSAYPVGGRKGLPNGIIALGSALWFTGLRRSTSCMAVGTP